MTRMHAIVAADEVNGIGLNGGIPWRAADFNKSDLAFFRAKTIKPRGGKPAIIMGRLTWLSIGRALPGRTNIVLSSSLTELPGAIVATSLADALKKVPDASIYWVIGGARIYKEFYAHPLACKIYVTHVPGNWNCDTFLPAVSWSAGRERSLPGDAKIITYSNPHTAPEETYNGLLRELLLQHARSNRTGINTRAVCGRTIRFPLMREGREVLPLLTCKRVPYKHVYIELLWFLRGESNINYLTAHGVHIWDANTTAEFIAGRGLALEPGETGPIYGCQWRNWNGHLDQIKRACDDLKKDPNNRRVVISAWNADQINQMVLPPCHYAFQLVIMNNMLNTVVSMRSADMGLGVPFNIASYAILTHMISRVLCVAPGEVIINMVDCHIYENQVEGVNKWLTVRPVCSPFIHFSKKITSAENLSVDDFGADDIEITEYYPAQTIKMAMAV